MKVKKTIEVDIEWFFVLKSKESPSWINHPFHSLVRFDHVAAWESDGLQMSFVNRPPFLPPGIAS